MAIFLLRHGQSTFNAVFDVTGEDPWHLDARLSELGRAQVAAVGPAVRKLGPDVVVTSPMTRALETIAAVFDGNDLPPVLVQRLGCDRFAGDSCDYGRSVIELRAEFPQFDFSDLGDDWWLPSGSRSEPTPERREDFAVRAQEFGRWLAARPEPVVLAVGHSGMFRALTGARMANGEIREWSEAKLAS